MDAIIPFLLLFNLTATIATIFAVVRKREGYVVALGGIALGWACFLLPWLFFGPTGAVIGFVVIMLVGGVVSYANPQLDRRRTRS